MGEGTRDGQCVCVVGGGGRGGSRAEGQESTNNHGDIILCNVTLCEIHCICKATSCSASASCQPHCAWCG